jgi:hypothetical protein
VWKAICGLCLLAIGLPAADSPFVGTWKMNAAKSKLEGSGLDSNTVVHVEQDGSGLKVSVEAKPGNFSYQAALDGKATKVTGSPVVDEISTQTIKEREMSARGIKGGLIVFVDLRTVSRDGKTMTITRSGSNPEGKPFKATLVFDKQ